MARWEKPLGKPMAYLGKTYFRGRSLSCIFGKTHYLVGKKFFRKTHGYLGKTYSYLLGGPHVEWKARDEGLSAFSCSIDGVGRRDDGAARS